MKKVLQLIVLFIVLVFLYISFSRYIDFTSESAELSVASDEPYLPTAEVVSTTSESSFPMVIPTAQRDSIVRFGLSLLGTPYVAAGCSAEGFDCSGFVFFVFQYFKIMVPRSSAQYESFGRDVSIDSVQKGDVLVFKSPTRDAIGHVGIVTKAAGMQSDFIHATSGKAMQVVISNLSQIGYQNRFIKAVSVLE